MAHRRQRLKRAGVFEAIRRVLADAIKNRSFVEPEQVAAAIAKSFPESGATPEEISQQIIEAARIARVPVKKAEEPGGSQQVGNVDAGG